MDKDTVYGVPSGSSASGSASVRSGEVTMQEVSRPGVGLFMVSAAASTSSVHDNAHDDDDNDNDGSSYCAHHITPGHATDHHLVRVGIPTVLPHDDSGSHCGPEHTHTHNHPHSHTHAQNQNHCSTALHARLVHRLHRQSCCHTSHPDSHTHTHSHPHGSMSTLVPIDTDIPGSTGIATPGDSPSRTRVGTPVAHLSSHHLSSSGLCAGSESTRTLRTGGSVGVEGGMGVDREPGRCTDVERDGLDSVSIVMRMCDSPVGYPCSRASIHTPCDPTSSHSDGIVPDPAQAGPAPAPNSHCHPSLLQRLNQTLTAHNLNPSLTLLNSGSVARDHLASERTFLAYVRTSMGVVMIGVALVQLLLMSAERSSTGDDARASVGRLKAYVPALGGVIISFGIVLLLIGFTRYFTIQHALTKGHFPAARMVVVGISTVSVVLVAVVAGFVLGGAR